MTYQVPNEFIPQSGQPISSSQMDENFDSVGIQITNLQNQVGGGNTGTYTEPRKVLYPQRPAYTGSAAPAANEFVDLKYLNATRGCRVGDIIFSINPNALPNDYGVVWAQMTGQPLSTTTYPEFAAIAASIGGSATGQYNPQTGATTGNITAPDWRGGVPMSILAGSAHLTSLVPGFSAANFLASLIGEAAHKQVPTEVANHTHGINAYPGTEPGNNRLTVGNATKGADTLENQTAAAVQAMNIVQLCFVSLIWVRIK